MNGRARLEQWRVTARDPNFRNGVIDILVAGPGIAAWALVTGVAMIKAGISLPMAIFMSLVMYAGSAQLAVLPLLVAAAPMWVIWLTATCVNLRFVIFSAMWRDYFHYLPLKTRLLLAYFCGDLIFVGFLKRFPVAGENRPAQLPYFSGAAICNWLCWQLPSIAGMFLADVIPLSWGLGFAGVLALLGILLAMINDRFTLLATVIAGTAAIAAYALPLKLNILVAVAAAVATGLSFEAVDRAWKRHQLRRKADAQRAGAQQPASVLEAPGVSAPQPEEKQP